MEVAKCWLSWWALAGHGLEFWQTFHVRMAEHKLMKSHDYCRSEDGKYNMKLFVLLLENYCEMPDKAETEMQDKCQAGLKSYAVCLLGLVQRVSYVKEVLLGRPWGIQRLRSTWSARVSAAQTPGEAHSPLCTNSCSRRQSRLNSCRLRKTPQPHFRRLLWYTKCTVLFVHL